MDRPWWTEREEKDEGFWRGDRMDGHAIRDGIEEGERVQGE